MDRAHVYMVTTCLPWNVLKCLSLPSKRPQATSYLPSYFLDQEAKAQGSQVPSGLETWLAPGQHSSVQCSWLDSGQCFSPGVGPFHESQLTLTVSFITHRTALWHLTHWGPLFLGSFHADYVAVPARVSHVKQMFMVICSCLCRNAFFYIEILLFL